MISPAEKVTVMDDYFQQFSDEVLIATEVTKFSLCTVMHREHQFRETFWKSIDIFLKKPHVVDRRLLAAVDIKDNHYKKEKKIIYDETTKVEDYCHGYDLALQMQRRLLPRQSEKLEPAQELILKDLNSQDPYCIFLHLQKINGVFQLPKNVHDTFGYKVKLQPDGRIALSVTKKYKTHHPSSVLPVLSPPSLEWLQNELLPKLAKWASEISPDEVIEARQSVISMDRYSQVYGQLKRKYGPYFVKIWPENTDPLKFVYEDIAIATYLFVLWEEERKREGLSKKQKFVDLGCGNGLLVHILNSEGHPGRGLDIRRRSIWDLYGPGTNLEECTISPSDGHLFPDADWLIGNHSDELTPWIPVMAFRSSENLRYFVLPCCFHDFSKKFLRKSSHKSQYECYLEFVKEVGETCGFEVKEDALRIPSTKRRCQIGFKRTYNPSFRSDVEEKISSYIRSRCMTSMSPASANNSEGRLNQSEQWITSFQPREKHERVRNCSWLEKNLVEDIVNKIAMAVLGKEESGISKEETCTGESKVCRLDRWRRGGKITFQEAVELFDSSTLKQLKSECGGLKTLLKNQNQVFEVRGNCIELRDWATQEDQNKPTKGRNSRSSSLHTKEELFKTKMCWFYMNHPDGCPRTSERCTFAHGIKELREKPPKD